MNITFVPFDKRKEKTSLRAFVYHRGQEYRISVGESVLTKYWSENKNRCKLVREYPDGAVINKNLDDIERIITDIINAYRLATPTETQIRNDFKTRRKSINTEAGGVTDEQQYIVNFAVKFMNEVDRKINTKKSYQTTINKLIEYEKAKHKSKLCFANIDVNFYNKFKKWLLNGTYIKGDKEYHFTKNYIGAIFKNITTFMNKSSEQKLHNFSGHRDKDFKTEKEDADAIYLNMEEVERIYGLEFTEDILLKNGYTKKRNNLQQAITSLNEERDRFLIGCYTALRHSDYSRIDVA
jgi:hypothetical protein